MKQFVQDFMLATLLFSVLCHLSGNGHHAKIRNNVDTSVQYTVVRRNAFTKYGFVHAIKLFKKVNTTSLSLKLSIYQPSGTECEFTVVQVLDISVVAASPEKYNIVSDNHSGIIYL